MAPPPIVLGIVLRLETLGWHGPPPQLAFDPMRVEAGAKGQQIFYYDLSPKEEGLTVETACARIGSRLERLLLSAESLGGDLVFAARLRLDVGLWNDGGRGRYSYSWPAEFLQILAGSEVELVISHYSEEAAEGDETGDVGN